MFRNCKNKIVGQTISCDMLKFDDNIWTTSMSELQSEDKIWRTLEILNRKIGISKDIFRWMLQRKSHLWISGRYARSDQDINSDSQSENQLRRRSVIKWKSESEAPASEPNVDTTFLHLNEGQSCCLQKSGGCVVWKTRKSHIRLITSM